MNYSLDIPQALSHVKVLDLTHYVAGPFCTKLLADYGADVIKVERPGMGDPGRRLGPFHRDLPHPEKCGTFLYLNHNKTGITLNLKTATGVRIFEELAQWADVVVESFRPGVMDRLGLSYEHMTEVKPGLIMTSISNFGQNGPYRGYKASEIIEYAIGGPMLFTGIAEREPARLGGRVGLYFAGQAASVATLMALYRNRKDSSGDHIDISIMETQAGTVDRQTALLVNHQYTGQRFSRFSSGETYLAGIYPCKDGYVDIRARERIPGMVRMLDRPDLLEDPRFATLEAAGRPGNIDVLEQMLRDWLAGHTRTEACARAQEHRVLAAPVYDMPGVFEDSHFIGRGLWTRTEQASVGLLRYAGRPFLMGETPWRLRRPAPRLGQHNRDVYCGMLGYTLKELSRLRQLGVV